MARTSAPEAKSARSGFAKILVGYDGSDQSSKALNMAKQISKGNNAELLIMEVVGAPTYYFGDQPGAPQADLSAYYEAAAKDAEKTIEGLVAKAQSEGVRARGGVLNAETSPVNELLECAKQENVDLIVVGTRGMGGFRKMLLGSVSSGLVSHASCSVLVVR